MDEQKCLWIPKDLHQKLKVASAKHEVLLKDYVGAILGRYIETMNP
jgi:hypothetical protein